MTKIQGFLWWSGFGLVFIDSKDNPFTNASFFVLFLKVRFGLDILCFSLLFFQSLLLLFVPSFLLTDDLHLVIKKLGFSFLPLSEIMFIEVDQGLLRFLFEQVDKVLLGLLDREDMYVLW
jgi:hypothetical protein